MESWSLCSIASMCIRWVIAMTKTAPRVELLKQVQALQKRLASMETAPKRPQSELEIALRERIKELDCLYTISTFREMYFHTPDRFLQSVVDCLPKSWQFPDHACARVTYGEKVYVTERFAEGKWRMAADITTHGRVAGMVEVFYRKGVPTSASSPFLKEEHALIRAVAERIGSVLMHMKTLSDLRDAHREIQREHQALQEANIALRAVLSRLEEEKRAIKAAVVANIQKVIMPIVFELELDVAGRQRSYVTLLRRSLQELTSPFLTQIARDHVQLTPVEIAISTMIRNGLSTKEIAQLRCISPGTVRRHRENVRRKLGLRNRKANLATYLQASVTEESPTAGNAMSATPPQILNDPSVLGGWTASDFAGNLKEPPK